MYILLTDIVSCPRCGPEFGLILLADRIESRRVLDGALGCANCRAKYAVRGGLADLRLPDARAATDDENATTAHVAPGEAAEGALRWAALMGVSEGPGFVLVAGPASALANEIAALLENIEVIAAGARLVDEERAGVSRIEVSDRLPFYSGKIRGAALTGAAADTLLEEGARVVGRMGRLVLDPAPADAEQRLDAAGLRIVAQQGRTIVAARV